ncbi:putative acyl-coenzyme A oxidase 3.2, peroxisomal [Hibiscus syriacus]|uniref:acyl-CoA oxidase n=1 Tax=Hibiscus syriacus TaxID=106335 RepID=A0A6A3CJR0_HIBSY|nr:putative acyl-coenzyme A oxidase 3.2, peroxisomal [Hibiscus syriacus]
MTELGHGSNHATHTIVFSQLNINGNNEGVHALIAQIRDADDNRFAAFMSPLTAGRVIIAVNAVYQSKVGVSIAIRYALTRRAFSLKPNEPEVLLLDYPSHQRRLLPLIAKIYALSFGANYLKMLYVKRTPQSNKTIHVSKALFAEYMAAQKRNKVFKGLGLEHMNKPCPVIPAHLTSTTLRCTQFQMDALCLRERELLNRFVADVSQCLAKGESKEQTFNMSYQVAEDLGKAFSDRAIFQTFVEAEATLASGSLKDVLGMVRSLYAFNCLEDITYLRYGFLSVDNGAAVRREITNLCSEVRPHALALVSSFGSPDAFLSPIAFNWVGANSWSSVQH